MQQPLMGPFNPLQATWPNPDLGMESYDMPFHNHSMYAAVPHDYQSMPSTLGRNYHEKHFSDASDDCYKLDLNRIISGEDKRTTIMIRNIPNKYKQSALLKELNKNHQGRYDFVYLPIDFKNAANVGYAFINFLHPLFILDFYNEFHDRKWSKFNSFKKCDLRYGRMQGLEEAKDHFKSSSVMHQSVSGARLFFL